MTDKYETLTDAARAAALSVLAEIHRLIEVHSRAVVILDPAVVPDQFFETLAAASNVNWTQVIVFQGSEYLGVDGTSAESLQKGLVARMITRTPIVEFYALRANAANQGAAAVNFMQVLSGKTPDLAVVGFVMFAGVDDKVGPMVTRRLPESKKALLSLAPDTFLQCPTLIAIGDEPVPERVLSHANSLVFQATRQ